MVGEMRWDVVVWGWRRVCDDGGVVWGGVGWGGLGAKLRKGQVTVARTRVRVRAKDGVMR